LGPVLELEQKSYKINDNNISVSALAEDHIQLATNYDMHKYYLSYKEMYLTLRLPS